MRQKLIQSLTVKYDAREAESIADYYVDAMYGRKQINLDGDIQKLLTGHPVQYVTNTSFFYGNKLYVDQSTLIPRPETEELVHWVISENKGSDAEILDIGTGSGCLLLSILSKLKEAGGIGLDIDPRVQKVFDKNKEILNVDAQFLSFDFLDKAVWTSLPKYDIIVSNPPYISKEEVERLGIGVFEHEPHLALFTGDDPLVFYRFTLEFAQTHLKKGGKIYFETSDLYHDEMVAMVSEYDFRYEFRKDMQGAWRMLKLWR
jgi:release factor glutamine methyltransferase